METKQISKNKELLILESDTVLNSEWGEKQLVISLSNARRILESFKVLGIKDKSSCLIFEDATFLHFRKAGEPLHFIYQYLSFAEMMGIGYVFIGVGIVGFYLVLGSLE
jgi:hypothetical protein